MSSSVSWPRVIRTAIVAGIVAGIVIDLYLYLVTVLPGGGTPIAMWQYVASTLLGANRAIAFTSPVYAVLGLLVHFIVSIGWAGGYGYLAQQHPFMNQRWLISGLIYGLVVYFFMQLLLLGSGNFAWPPTPLGWVIPIVGHMVFFGVPLACLTARLDRT